MNNRLELHEELLKFNSNVYFQPPSNIKMVYPCIVYNKTGKSINYGNNESYLAKQEYQIMVIDKNPDSRTADLIEDYFRYCYITQYYTVDNLNHTTLTLYY